MDNKKKFIIKNVSTFIIICICLLLLCGCSKKQLEAPVISLDNDNLVIWESVKNADKYLIIVNDSDYTTQEETTFKSFSKEGTYVIEVVAVSNKNKYRDSEKSNSVQYTIKPKEDLDHSYNSSFSSSFDYFERCQTKSRTINVVDTKNFSSDEIITSKSIQGILAKNGIAIYLLIDDYDKDIIEKLNEYNLNYLNSFSDLISIYKNELNQVEFICYNPDQHELAITMSGINQKPIGSTNLQNKLSQYGLSFVNVSSSSKLEDIINTEQLNTEVVVSNSKCIDLSIMNGFIYTTNNSVIENIDNSLQIGSKDENNLSYQDTIINNLSCLSILEYKNKNLEDESNNAGDFITLVNVSVENNFGSDYFIENNAQPTFLTAIAPILNGFYGSQDDYSIGKLFGNISSNATNQLLNDFVTINNIYFGKNNYKYVLLNNDEQYLSEKLSLMNNIQGAFINEIGGEISWINNKPFVSFTATLTESNAYKLAAQLNELKDNTEKDFVSIKIDDNTTYKALKMFYSFIKDGVNIVTCNQFMKELKNNPIDKCSTLNDEINYNVSSEYYEYDMYDLTYSECDESLYFLFTNDLNGFSSFGTAYSNNQCAYLQGNGLENSILYNKLSIPNWETVYLNYKIKTNFYTRVKVTLFDVQEKEFIEIYDEYISNTNFQTLSFDLSGSGLVDKEIVIIFELNSSSLNDFMMIDDVKISRTKEREEIFEKEIEKITTEHYIYQFNDSEFSTYGDVKFENNMALLYSDEIAYHDDAASYIASHVTLFKSSTSHPQLTVKFVESENTLFRVRIIDSKYINYLLCNWTKASSDEVTFDLSIFSNETIFIFIELNKKENSDTTLKIAGLEIKMVEGHYYYKPNEMDSFYGTSKEFNLCGWHINDYATFGDLTGDIGYGSLRLDGTNNGVYNPELVIGEAYKYYHLGNASSYNISFKSRSGGPTNATFIRVKVTDEAGNSVIVSEGNEYGWIKVAGEGWNDIKCNLDQFAGQKIKISIEQTDHGTGIGEIAFIDCIVVEEV